ncbi:MAG: hypothetical protein VW712_09365 [Paracoccaceae bacterium]
MAELECYPLAENVAIISSLTINPDLGDADSLALSHIDYPQ